MSQSQPQDIAEVFRQLMDVLKKTLAKMTELEEKLTAQIANLTKQVKSLSQSKSQSSPQALKEITQRLSRAITQIDQRVSMFTITEMLAQLERSTAPAPVAAIGSPSRVVVAPRRLSSTGSSAARTKRAKAGTSTSEKPEEATGTEEAPSEPEVVSGDQVGGDWREKMKRKYGLKEEPGSLL